MIHALHIFTELHMGDNTKSFLDFLASYDRNELSVSVILPQESPIKQEVEQTGHSPILLKNIGDTAHSFFGRRSLRKEVRCLSPQVIHVYGGWPCDALQSMGIPIVDSPTDVDYARGDRGYRIITAHSPQMAEKYASRGISEDVIRLLPPGIIPPEPMEDAERISKRHNLGYEPDDIVVGVFHPLTKTKGYPLLFAAAALAKETCPHLRFLIVGSGNMKQQYMRKVISLGLKKFVRFVHSPDDDTALLNLLDMQFSISEHTGVSRSMLEGMSLGLPSIAFGQGGNRFMIENGVSGLLIDQITSKRIAGAILQLVDHPSIALSLGANAKKRAEALFSACVSAKATLSIYQTLLGENPSHEETTAPST